MSTTQQAQQPEDREIHGTADIYSVVSELLARTAPGLSKEELEWFKKSGEIAQASFRNFAAALKAIEQSGAFDSNKTVSRMLFFFSDYVRCLEAMIFVADFADEQLRIRELMEQ